MKKIELSVYLVNLKKYNENKENYGSWVDLTQDRESVEEQVDTIVGYDDCAIHDSETNLEIKIKTDTDIYILLDLVEVLKTTDFSEPVINNILSQYVYIEDAIDVINNQSFDYYDNVNNEEELGYILAEYLGLTENVRSYFNHENYGRDAALEGWHIAHGAAVCIF